VKSTVKPLPSRPSDQRTYVREDDHQSRRAAAIDLIGTSLSDYEISRQTGASRSSIQRWRQRGAPTRGRDNCRRDWQPTDPASYSYLLGIYLGDGYIGKASQTPVLEISLDSRYPGIVEECSSAIRNAAEVDARVHHRLTREGASIRLTAGSPIWLAAFPQHGPGKKHLRSIKLATWQTQIVDRFPEPFLRGLIHSDGSRTVNRFSVALRHGSRTYAYPRYFFTNLSADIRDMFCVSCERLGIRWTRSSNKNISVADRRSVELLDSFVGPKSDAGGGT
jgi:hypothetical protein